MGWKRKQTTVDRKKKKTQPASCNNNDDIVCDQSKPQLPFLELTMSPVLKISINPFSKLLIMITPSMDVAHPRHLCFFHPFSLTSHRRRYCIKCCCCLCDTIARCSKWVRRPLMHCDAMVEYEHERMKMLQWKYLSNDPPPNPSNPCTLYISVMRGPNQLLLQGFAGGLIVNEKGKWVAGFSMKFSYEDSKAHIHILTAIYEGLKLAHSINSEPIKYLNIHLGIAFEPNFFHSYFNCSSNVVVQKDVDQNGVIRPRTFSILPRSSLPRSDSPDSNDDLYGLLEIVEEYLNHPDWVVVDIKEAKTVEELPPGAVALVLHTRRLEVDKQFFDFTSDRLTDALKHIARLVESKGLPLKKLFLPNDENEAMDFVGGLTPDGLWALLIHPNWRISWRCGNCNSLNITNV